ncbi:riboflavin synthase [Marinitoga sp. 38H-ov]|uniref:riboflavin synthase n=1 Tax=Marinitoga sp. 38H-ov TaxID=1755814 RepID=UPI0013EC710B|nr:riboflavin synthase [Marinitoga sp. 38H-ov]KAF2955189.1 riboflavin synthase subunit alpha [Marinitoga sp. 38H-ov]
MFTGIIQKIGKMKMKKNKVIIQNPFDNVSIGESIAINGVCLTVENIEENYLYFSLGEETINKTNLKYYNNKYVNLERALRASDFLGGHIVSGHVDGTIAFLSLRKSQDTYWMRFKSPSEKWAITEKGSITINGISLTIARKDLDSFMVQVIEHTFKNTNLQYLKSNDLINYEIDIFNRYIKNIINNIHMI